MRVAAAGGDSVWGTIDISPSLRYDALINYVISLWPNRNRPSRGIMARTPPRVSSTAPCPPSRPRCKPRRKTGSIGAWAVACGSGLDRSGKQACSTPRSFAWQPAPRPARRPPPRTGSCSRGSGLPGSRAFLPLRRTNRRRSLPVFPGCRGERHRARRDAGDGRETCPLPPRTDNDRAIVRRRCSSS